MKTNALQYINSAGKYENDEIELEKIVSNNKSIEEFAHFNYLVVKKALIFNMTQI